MDRNFEGENFQGFCGFYVILKINIHKFLLPKD